MDGYLRALPDEREQWLDGETSIDTAVERLRDAAAADGERQDVVTADLRSLSYGGNDEGVCVLTGPSGTHPIRHHAFGQLAAHIGAPARFLARMPEDLQVPVIRWGMGRIADANAPCMLRLAGGDLRALVSSRYAVCDHPAAMGALAEALKAAGLADDAEVVSTATGLTLLVRAIWRGRDVPTQDGATLSIGLDLTNGEAGNRAIALAPVVYHSAAAAACRKATWRRRHIGASDTLVADLTQAIPEAMLAAEDLRKLVLRASSESVDDAVAEAESLRKIGLTIPEAREVVRSLMRGRGLDVPQDSAEWPDLLAGIANATVYDVWLALVESAKTRATDRRLDVEDAAGRYLAARLR